MNKARPAWGSTLSTRVSTENAEAFKAIAAGSGVKPSRLLGQLIIETVAWSGRIEPMKPKRRPEGRRRGRPIQKERNHRKE